MPFPMSDMFTVVYAVSLRPWQKHITQAYTRLTESGVYI